jgi:hypothetical protein
VQDCNELDDTEEGRDEDVVGTDEDAGGVDDALPLQTAPLMVGRSAAPLLFLFTWKPKLTVWPGWRVPFQPRLDAV